MDMDVDKSHQIKEFGDANGETVSPSLCNGDDHEKTEGVDGSPCSAKVNGNSSDVTKNTLELREGTGNTDLVKRNSSDQTQDSKVLGDEPNDSILSGEKSYKEDLDLKDSDLLLEKKSTDPVNETTRKVMKMNSTDKHNAQNCVDNNSSLSETVVDKSKGLAKVDKKDNITKKSDPENPGKNIVSCPSTPDDDQKSSCSPSTQIDSPDDCFANTPNEGTGVVNISGFNTPVEHPPDSVSPTNEKKAHSKLVGKPASRSNTPTMSKSSRSSTPVMDKNMSRSATPVNDKSKSRSATPASDKNKSSRSVTPVDEKVKTTPVVQKSKLKKKEPKPSKVSQVLKGASDEMTNLRPIAQLLFDIGMDVTRQYVYRDLIKIQKKKETMDKLDEKEKQQLEKLQGAYDNLISKNSSFMTEVISCVQCGFKTDAVNILELHKEYAHNQEYNMFTCSFCSETTKVASAFLYHMEAIHNRKGRIFMKHAFFICPYCPYESNNRGPFQKHMDKCMKNFREKNNLIPLAPDCDIPLKAPKKPTPKPVVVAEKKSAPHPTGKVVSQSVQELQEAHRAHQARMAVQRSNVIAKQFSNSMPRQPIVPPRAVVPRAAVPFSRPVATRHAAPVSQPQRLASPAQNSSPTNANSNTTGTLVQMNGQWYRLAMVGNQQFLMPVPPPSVNQMPQNRPIIIQGSGNTANTSLQNNSVQKDSNFEVCEICGGFVKDRESLRIHFYWAHKVDIHKDIFQSPNPPLACVICSKTGKNVKFWTYQGLSRHRSLEHKADKENDTSVSSALFNEIPKKCVVCSHVYLANTTVQQYWSHMEIHGITPVKLFLLKKCLICGQGIDDQKLLEKHLLGNHSLLFRNIALRGIKDTPSKETNKQTNKSKPTVCNLCTISFSTLEAYFQHCNEVHVFQCSRCLDKLSSRETLMKHFHDRHSDEKDPCLICHKMVKIGRPMVRHMKGEHIKKCSVVLTRLPKQQVAEYQKKRKLDDSLNILQTKAPKHRSSRKSSENEVIVIDLDSPPRMHVTNMKKPTEGEPVAKKQILEVDGEEIVVEIQQDEDTDEESADNKSPGRNEQHEDMDTTKDNGGEESLDKSVLEIEDDNSRHSNRNSENNSPDHQNQSHKPNGEEILIDEASSDKILCDSEDDEEVPEDEKEEMDISS